VFNWLDWLSQYDRSSIFKQFCWCLKMFTIISVTSCTCEGMFSKLTIVKNKLRNTIGQERLNALLFLFVEQELTIVCSTRDHAAIKRKLVRVCARPILTATCRHTKGIRPPTAAGDVFHSTCTELAWSLVEQTIIVLM